MLKVILGRIIDLKKIREENKKFMKKV